ncbi:MAG TPA: hypothetical protein PLZ95_10325 [Bryobacteraceae bacterium]|nr:hypothetical protein [Bryobacteraceae bacterium]
MAVNRALTRLCLAALALPLAASGPVEAGRTEVRLALTARQLPESNFRHTVEQSMALPFESYQIQGALIRGGSPRAILYALIEASESIARKGVVSSATGQAQIAIRGVRRTLSTADFDLPPAQWRAWFRSLALARFNRVRFILPPAAGSVREFLQLATELADQYAMDISIQPDSSALDDLPELLRISPTIRAVHAAAAQSPAASKAAAGAGRYVVVETGPGVTVASAVPSRVLAPWKPGAPRPCLAGCELVWLMGDEVAPTVALLDTSATGFEIDHTRLQAWSGFGYAIKEGAPAPAKVRRATSRKKKAATSTRKKKTITPKKR